ncbi:MAG: AlpA family phage regulatory protein [Chloroflexi bacterium]|nr:AlpA family phage regulatory protein [Chloroflexota bacterium]MYD46863.1 AlpA family phage regulatory protein [Chloroflexota bacterium]
MTQRPQEDSPDRSMRRHEVELRCGLSTNTIYRKMREGTFPRPQRVGARAARWPESEIERWLSERPRAGDDDREE